MDPFKAYLVEQQDGKIAGRFVQFSPDQFDRGEVTLRIADRGSGLRSEQAAQAFERFHRIARPDDPPGHGLGLSLAREIIVLMHGHITLNARPDGGSAVVITLPQARP
jgi:signal transduction histidine kinase